MAQNNKQATKATNKMTNLTNTNNQDYRGRDLEERTFRFAKGVASFCKKLPKNLSNIEYIKQVIRSSGSTGSNFIEANDSLGKKDFLMRIRIYRKEAKESGYWLRLIIEANDNEFKQEGQKLYNETTELRSIFSVIIEKARQ